MCKSCSSPFCNAVQLLKLIRKGRLYDVMLNSFDRGKIPEPNLKHSKILINM